MSYRALEIFPSPEPAHAHAAILQIRTGRRMVGGRDHVVARLPAGDDIPSSRRRRSCPARFVPRPKIKGRRSRAVTRTTTATTRTASRLSSSRIGGIISDSPHLPRLIVAVTIAMEQSVGSPMISYRQRAIVEQWDGPAAERRSAEVDDIATGPLSRPESRRAVTICSSAPTGSGAGCRRGTISRAAVSRRSRSISLSATVTGVVRRIFWRFGALFIRARLRRLERNARFRFPLRRDPDSAGDRDGSSYTGARPDSQCIMLRRRSRPTAGRCSWRATSSAVESGRSGCRSAARRIELALISLTGAFPAARFRSPRGSRSRSRRPRLHRPSRDTPA